MNTLAVIPFSAAYDSHSSRQELLDILATAQFWRTRIVEFTLLALLVFWLAFAFAARL